MTVGQKEVAVTKEVSVYHTGTSHTVSLRALVESDIKHCECVSVCTVWLLSLSRERVKKT